MSVRSRRVFSSQSLLLLFSALVTLNKNTRTDSQTLADSNTHTNIHTNGGTLVQSNTLTKRDYRLYQWHPVGSEVQIMAVITIIITQSFMFRFIQLYL